MAKIKDVLEGDVYGELKVVSKIADTRFFNCICINGLHEKKVRGDHLNEKNTCVECRKNNKYVGEFFNRLEVVEYLRSDKYFNKTYKVRCFCGNEFEVIISAIKSGHTRSCGCIINKYGDLSKDERYSNWYSMKQRTTNKNNTNYQHYRDLIQGVMIEPEWVDNPEYFYDEIGQKNNAEDTIDRIDNHKGYVKGNVRWADKKTQQLNRDTKRGISGHKYISFDKRRNKFVSYNYNGKFIGQFDDVESALVAQKTAMC